MKPLLLALVLLCACNPVKRSLRIANSNPKEFAAFCATQFPVKDSVYVKDSVRFDTLLVDSDPIIQTTIVNDTVLRTVYFPGPVKFITKTITRDSIIVRRDMAKETDLGRQINDLIVNNKDVIGQRNKFHDGRDWWRTVALILAGILGLQLVWKLWLSKYFAAFKLFK